jgi:deazaflavin-dependent oxidoreductase (nitroreductase family)
MPSDLAFKALNTVHHAILSISRGRFGGQLGGMPVLELTTTGRTTGRPHTVLLTSPVRSNGAYVVVASRGGDDHHPGWFLNLQKDPNVQVALQGGVARPMRARETTPEERARLWPQVTADFRNYADYQSKTERVIPLVLLEEPA